MVSGELLRGVHLGPDILGILCDLGAEECLGLLESLWRCLVVQVFHMSVCSVVYLCTPSCTSAVTSPCFLVMIPGPFILAISFSETSFVLFMLVIQPRVPAANGCPLTLVLYVIF